jgi:hypothetical protein
MPRRLQLITPLIGPKGEDGKDGAIFTPSVSEDGTLSWTNDKGLPNPTSVNIRGPQGETGTSSGGSGVHVGPDAPTDSAINVWIDTDDGETVVLVEAPVTANVGQTIVVKAVDENGTPVAWEAADLPDSYTKSQIDTIMGAYINDIDALIGGDS